MTEVGTEALIVHEQRFDTRRVATGAHQALAAPDAIVQLEPRLRELVKDQERLFALAAWQESPFFTARERAALRFTDAVTELAPGGVADDVYEEARAYFDESELPQLLFAIAVINAWNGLAIASRKRTLH